MHFSPIQAALVSIVEYILVMAAIANVYIAAFYTGSWTINTISCGNVWYPAFWAVSTLFIHIFGSWCLALRVNTPEKNKAVGTRGGKSVWRWIRYEIMPCITHDKMELIWKPEGYLFIVISWWTSLLTVVHLLWGTIALSSIQFIGYVDSIQIIARFMASAVICRAILMFELAGMRNALTKESTREEYSLVRVAPATLPSNHNV